MDIYTTRTYTYINMRPVANDNRKPSYTYINTNICNVDMQWWTEWEDVVVIICRPGTIIKLKQNIEVTILI